MERAVSTSRDRVRGAVHVELALYVQLWWKPCVNVRYVGSKFISARRWSSRNDDVCRYFLSQNDAIDAGTASGVKVNVKNIGMGGPYMVRRRRYMLLSVFN